MDGAQDWSGLGAALRARREDLRWSQDAVGQQIGVQRNALRRIEGGIISRVSSTVRAYARVIGWTDDSVDAVLAGGQPTLREDVDEEQKNVSAQVKAEPDVAGEVARALMSRLPARIVQEIVDGQVVEHDVLDLRPDGSSALMTLVVERSPEVSTAQVQEDLRHWSDVQRQLRKLLQEAQD
ncbi:helix-turn-helix domain-containing protein [Streptomyces roseolus]|uniref:helix-turn-helix domain-containing protein n=1 Tax=Streptomyces roseolus TaxID=67358 RepID=UPI0037938164